MLARNLRKAARSALWLPVPDGFWDANTKAVPSSMEAQPARRAMSVSASAAGEVIRDPGRLQLDRPPGGVVHLRYRQAEPVPQAPEPFAAGPGDRLLQLPPVDEISRAGGGAGHGCHTRCGQAAWVFMIWCRRIPVHRGLPTVLG